MPEQAWNRAVWDGRYDWKDGGEEWSAAWGNSEAQWFGSLYPRLHRFLPTATILEIAPGCGRWTSFLLRNCNKYLGIDISVECVETCRRRFVDAAWAKFEANDGVSLEVATDQKFDLVFSFDSLVHVEMDVMEAYLAQIVKKLSAKGVAFIHHSNLLDFKSVLGTPHLRAPSVSARRVAKAVDAAKGRILVQELINWGGEACHDCLTLFGRADAISVEPLMLENPQFMEEATLIHRYQSPYSTLSFSRKAT